MLAQYARRREAVVSGLASVPGVRCAFARGSVLRLRRRLRALRPEGGRGLRGVLRAAAAEAGVAAVPGDAFGEDDCVRFSFATPHRARSTRGCADSPPGHGGSGPRPFRSRMPAAFLTGGTGFLGWHVAKALLEEGFGRPGARPRRSRRGARGSRSLPSKPCPEICPPRHSEGALAGLRRRRPRRRPRQGPHARRVPGGQRARHASSCSPPPRPRPGGDLRPGLEPGRRGPRPRGPSGRRRATRRGPSPGTACPSAKARRPSPGVEGALDRHAARGRSTDRATAGS